MHMTQCRVGRYNQIAALYTYCVSCAHRIVVRVRNIRINVYCVLCMQRANVLPVLKHGPRSLMCVQVRNRDHTMHN